MITDQVDPLDAIATRLRDQHEGVIVCEGDTIGEVEAVENDFDIPAGRPAEQAAR
jgi:hypothetical protein